MGQGRAKGGGWGFLFYSVSKKLLFSLLTTEGKENQNDAWNGKCVFWLGSNCHSEQNGNVIVHKEGDILKMCRT